MSSFRFPLTVTVCSILSGAIGCERKPEVSVDPRRNVLLVVIDTLRADHVGSYGYRRDTTPNLDGLAGGGTRYDRAIATAPWTLPSVASVFTGLYPDTHGATDVKRRLPADIPTIASTLQTAGWKTTGIVGNVLLSRRYGMMRGFQRYAEADIGDARHVSTHSVTDKAVLALDYFAKFQQPWFLFVHYFDPHYDYMAHPEYGFAKTEPVGRFIDPPEVRALRAIRDTLTSEELTQLRDLYDEEIRFADAGLGRVLSALERGGEAKDTIVIVVSDHGEAFGDHGWLGHTANLHEELIAVPLVVRGPGVPRDLVVKQPVSIASIAPTILSLAGAPGPTPEFDVGPLPLDDLPPSNPVFASVAFEPVRPENADKAARADAVLLGSRKLIVDHQRHTTVVYDLAGDPDEASPLTPDAGDPAGTLRTHLDRHLADRKAGAAEGAHRAPLAEDEIETLRSLGYVQ